MSKTDRGQPQPISLSGGGAEGGRRKDTISRGASVSVYNENGGVNRIWFLGVSLVLFGAALLGGYYIKNAADVELFRVLGGVGGSESVRRLEDGVGMNFLYLAGVFVVAYGVLLFFRIKNVGVNVWFGVSGWFGPIALCAGLAYAQIGGWTSIILVLLAGLYWLYWMAVAVCAPAGFGDSGKFDVPAAVLLSLMGVTLILFIWAGFILKEKRQKMVKEVVRMEMEQRNLTNENIRKATEQLARRKEGTGEAGGVIDLAKANKGSLVMKQPKLASDLLSVVIPAAEAISKKKMSATETGIVTFITVPPSGPAGKEVWEEVWIVVSPPHHIPFRCVISRDGVNGTDYAVTPLRANEITYSGNKGPDAKGEGWQSGIGGGERRGLRELNNTGIVNRQYKFQEAVEGVPGGTRRRSGGSVKRN